VEPLVVCLGSAHVVISNTIAFGRVSSDCGAVTTLDDDHSVSIIRIARVSVVDENITSPDVGRRGLKIAASALPAVNVMEAIAEVLGTDLLLTARIATAWKTLIQVLVTTSKDALADKVGAITILATVATVIIAPIGPGSALIMSAVAIVVGTIPPLLGISNNIITIVLSGSKTTETKNSNNTNSLHFFFNNNKKKTLK